MSPNKKDTHKQLYILLIKQKVIISLRFCEYPVYDVTIQTVMH